MRRELSIPYLAHKSSSLLGPAGCLRRASSRVSTSRSLAIKMPARPSFQFPREKSMIEAGIVDDQRCVANEGKEFIRNFDETSVLLCRTRLKP